MKWSLGIGFLVAILGLALLRYAQTMPVYTDPGAPERLSFEMAGLPRDQRFRDFYQQLSRFETPHKYNADLGRGLIAAGLGLVAAALYVQAFLRYPAFRRWWIAVWVGLWVMKFPLSLWYYSLRQERQDYPSWGDSIGMPIFSEWISWVFFGAITTGLLLFLVRDRDLPERFGWIKPDSVAEWFRISFLALWMLFTAAVAVTAIPDGNQGMAFPCIVAIVILVVILLARKRPLPAVPSS